MEGTRATTSVPADAPTTAAVTAGVTVLVTGTCGFPLCVLRETPRLLSEQPLQKAIFDSAQLSHLSYAPSCKRCERKSECFGLREEYIQTFGDRGIRPF